MKAEDYALKWAKEHPDASPYQSFLEGVRYAINRDKGTIQQRKDVFRNEVLQFRYQYPDQMLKDFYEYWTELGKLKMRFEKEKTFEVSKRLARWANNNYNGNRYNTHDTRQQQADNRSIFQAADEVLQTYK